MHARELSVAVRVAGTGQRAFVRLTQHALERWHERARPGMKAARAAAELVDLLEAEAQLAASPPGWLQERRGVCLYLLCGDFVLPVEIGSVGELSAVTVLARAGVSWRERDRRKVDSSRRRARRHAPQKTGRRLAPVRGSS